MLKTFYGTIIILFWFSHSALSQLPDTLLKLPFPIEPTASASGSFCATDMLLNRLRASDKYLRAEEIMNREIREAVRLFDEDSIVLPVVFHILADDPYAIPDQTITDGLAALNDAFAKRGAWAASKGVDTKIRFCLAKKDPEGGNATGITRVSTHWGNHLNPIIGDAKMKATAQWDPLRYINIWYVRSIEMESFAEFICGTWNRLDVGGYATLPPGGGPTDGIVVTGFGHLLAHEMGHYLGLYHTFEGLCFNNNCEVNGDRVCDTPPDGSYKSSPCANPENSCNTDTLSNYSNGFFTTNVPDPIDNIMDYGGASCQFTFTQGQAERMLNAINTQRSGLLEAKCLPPCTDNVTAAFKRNIVHPIQGDQVEFQNTSNGTTTYQWFLDGVQVSTAQNFKYQFNQQGRFKVTLKAFKDNNCFGSFSEFVIVDCGVVARFYTDKLRIASEKIIYQDTIRFTNNSYGANEFKWLVSHDKGMAEQVFSTNPDLNFIFEEQANYTFRLIASKGQCNDTTLIYRVSVEDPKADGTAYMNAVHCYEQTKIRVNFWVCNSGYDTLPANTPISFYNADPRIAGAKKVGGTFYTPAPILGNCCGWLYSYIIDVGSPGLNELWMALNDSGKVLPLQFPNTAFIEKNYLNNLSVSKNFQMKVTPVPASVIMEPGDTFRLGAVAGPNAISSYTWSPATRMSCTTCQAPDYIADTIRNTTKRVIATSIYSCYDTTYATITVPPYNDFRVKIDSADCTASDSIRVHFTLFNDFKRGILPKGLTVRFYDADPFAAGAVWLGPSFSLTDSILKKQQGFQATISGQVYNSIFAVVNDSSGSPPIILPNTRFEEKNYNNNTSSFVYQRLNVVGTPVVSISEPGDTLALNAEALPGSGIKYQWHPVDRLTCTNCAQSNYVADTTRLITKYVIATNAFGCRDTAMVSIQVPPYHDFRIQIDSAECTGTDSIRIAFTVFNDFKRPVLPKGLTIRFYNGDPQTGAAILLSPAFILKDSLKAPSANFTTRIQAMPTGNLYAVVNDSAGNPPVALPNTWLEEKDYGNNIAMYNYQRLNVVATPLIGLIEPGDTLVLEANAGPGVIKSYTWSPAYNLSCSGCQTPNLFADTTTTKRVIAENIFGCRDTAFLPVNIPPADDFTIQIDETICAANDSMYVRFTAENLFRRGYLPRGLTIRFYDADPRLAGTNELQPPVVLPANIFEPTRSFSTFIRQSTTGKLFVAINDSGIAKPLVFPSSKRLEKDYGNNVAQVDYTPETLRLSPGDTTITRGASFPVTILNTLDNPASTRWQTGSGYSLSCTNCVSPVVTATQFSAIAVESLNRYRCILKGVLNVKILPPDFTLSITQTECINNQTTLVSFTICMNNGYDSVWRGIPVTFYDGNPGHSAARILQTVFVTPTAQRGACFDYIHNIGTPQVNTLFAVVNDRGLVATTGADAAFVETSSNNNIAEAVGFKRFAVSILPGDTTINRALSLALITVVEGGNLQSVTWTPNFFLSCTTCFNPIVTPTFTDRYYVTGQNENQCTDTAMVIVRTITTGDLFIPDAFTPNTDRLNDIFYVMGSERVMILKDFIIYTRLGDKVFEAHNIPPNDPLFGWNGLNKGIKAMPGAYVYQVTATMTDGRTELKKGTVVLIR